jgi:hypothetical protein
MKSCSDLTLKSDNQLGGSGAAHAAPVAFCMQNVIKPELVLIV